MSSKRTIRRALVMTVNALALAVASGARADSEAARVRGAAVFSQYCVLCHGVDGKGDGRAAAMQKAPPADLTVSVLGAEYRRRIVLQGGAGVGRSVSMPAWAEVLTEGQIEDLLIHLDALAASAPAAPISRSGRK